jgi:RNase P/RNase MRP subunit p30
MSIIELGSKIEEMEEYEPLPEGQYIATIRSVEIKHSEKLPHGYFNIQMLVEPEQYPADYDAANNPEGTPLTYARVQVPTSENRRSVNTFRKFLAVLGMEPKGDKFSTEDWVNKEVQVLLKRTEYQGNPTNNVESVMPVPTV